MLTMLTDALIAVIIDVGDCGEHTSVAREQLSQIEIEVRWTRVGAETRIAGTRRRRRSARPRRHRPLIREAAFVEELALQSSKRE